MSWRDIEKDPPPYGEMITVGWTDSGFVDRMTRMTPGDHSNWREASGDPYMDDEPDVWMAGPGKPKSVGDMIDVQIALRVTPKGQYGAFGKSGTGEEQMLRRASGIADMDSGGAMGEREYFVTVRVPRPRVETPRELEGNLEAAG